MTRGLTAGGMEMPGLDLAVLVPTLFSMFKEVVFFVWCFFLKGEVFSRNFLQKIGVF